MATEIAFFSREAGRLSEELKDYILTGGFESYPGPEGYRLYAADDVFGKIGEAVEADPTLARDPLWNNMFNEIERIVRLPRVGTAPIRHSARVFIGIRERG